MDQRHHLNDGTQTQTLEPPEQQPESRPRVVDETRAAALLGVSAEKLRRLHSKTGLGRAEQEGREEVVFTYAELYRLCRSAVMVSD